MIGFGAIARALSTLELPFDKMIIIDKIDYKDLITDFFKEKGGTTKISFAHFKVTSNNLNDLIKTIVDHEIKFVIDCAYNIDTYDIVKHLPEYTSYINTSLEIWEDDTASELLTLKARQERIHNWYNHLKPKKNILLDCGMNPGLISLWAHDCCSYFKIDKNKVKQCIISEMDTQRAILPRKESEFISTWSPDGFMEEIHSPVEGHSNGKYYCDKNKTGYQTRSISIRPSGQLFYGFTVRHAEAITLHKFFKNATIMYIYKPPDEAVSSLFEYQVYTPITKEIIMYSPEIIDGVDELGALIATDHELYWYGSKLSNDDVKKYDLHKYLNATSYQVACGLWIGIQVLLDNMKNDKYMIMTPEDIVYNSNFTNLLNKVNEKLHIEKIKFDTTENVEQIIKNQSFPAHYLTNKH